MSTQYDAYWDQEQGSGMRKKLGTAAHITDVLNAVGLPPGNFEAERLASKAQK